nr:immunoglobulin light chain junction region [Macaca mulatta]MOV81982.1 immunoglobulin light chain junction region [Macaca mulatta]
CLQSRNSYSF